MKKLIFLIMLIPVFASAQVSTSFGIGYDTKGSPLANWAIGYTKGIVNIQGEIRPSITRKVEMNNYTGFRLSANLAVFNGLYILPGVEYYYNLKSQDKTNLNKWEVGYGLKSLLKVTNTGLLFIDCSYIGKFIQVIGGIQVNIN